MVIETKSLLASVGADRQDIGKKHEKNILGLGKCAISQSIDVNYMSAIICHNGLNSIISVHFTVCKLATLSMTTPP